MKKHITLLSFSSAAILHSLVSLVANILIMRWISPEQLGIWQTIIVFKTYALILNLASSNGLNRELPFLLGRGHQRIAKSIAESALFISIAASMISLSVFAASSLFIENTEVSHSLMILGVVSSLAFLNMYFSTTFRTNQAFLLLSKINLVLSGVELISLYLPAAYGYEGFLGRFVIIEMIKLGLFLKFQPFPVLPKFTWFGFKYLLRTGIPLFISTYVSGIADTLNRIILIGVSNFEMVGLFAPALAVYSLNNLLPKALSQYIFPKLNYGLGQGQSPRELWAKSMKFAMVNMVLMAPVILIGWFVIPPAINAIFPTYSVGAYAAQIALMSGLFVPFGMLMNFFHTLKSWIFIYILVGLKLALFFTLQWYFVRLMPPLTGIAYATLIAQVVYAVIIVSLGFWFVRRASKYASPACQRSRNL